MEYYIAMSSFMKYVLSLTCYCMVLRVAVFGQEERSEFTAIFNFGDSNSDTGSMAAAFPSSLSPSKPYGQTYFNHPVGRYSDGRLIIDFITESLGLPYLSAYLDSQGTNFKHGANFAAAAATIQLPNRVVPNVGFSPFYLDVQFSQFMRLLQYNKFGSGGPEHDKYSFFKQALYTFDIGQNDLSQNDLSQGFLEKLPIQQVNASVPDIINSFYNNFKNIYNTSGGTSFWIHNTGPIGCLPFILNNFPSAKRDKAGCSKPHNEVAQYFNYQLKQAVVQLRKELPLAAITYVDVYSAKYSLIKRPHRYGFEKPLVACCGYGGRYNYNNNVGCGGTAQVDNGSQIFVGSCERPWARINWDGIHYTEAANKAVFAKISTGAFSDPPLALKKNIFPR